MIVKIITIKTSPRTRIIAGVSCLKPQIELRIVKLIFLTDSSQTSKPTISLISNKIDGEVRKTSRNKSYLSLEMIILVLLLILTQKVDTSLTIVEIIIEVVVVVVSGAIKKLVNKKAINPKK